MSTKGKARVLEKFSINEYQAKFIKLFEDVKK